MQYDGLAWAFALLALLAALVAGRILFERTWFLGWLRGTCGLAFVAVAALLLVLAWDLRSYSLLKPEQPIREKSSILRRNRFHRPPFDSAFRTNRAR